jgi:hypothetical protein
MGIILIGPPFEEGGLAHVAFGADGVLGFVPAADLRAALAAIPASDGGTDDSVVVTFSASAPLKMTLSRTEIERLLEQTKRIMA